MIRLVKSIIFDIFDQSIGQFVGSSSSDPQEDQGKSEDSDDDKEEDVCMYLQN